MAETQQAAGKSRAADIVGNVFKGGEGKPRERKARTPAGRKKDLSTGIGMVWAMGGGALAMRGELAGRVMQVQAPVAGRELNRWVKEHDLIYSILAPVLGAEEITVLSKVVGPPILVGLLQHRPEMMPMLRPMVMPMLWDLFKELKKYEAKEEEVFAALTDSMEDQEAAEQFREFVTALGLGGDVGPPHEEVPVAGSEREGAEGDGHSVYETPMEQSAREDWPAS